MEWVWDGYSRTERRKVSSAIPACTSLLLWAVAWLAVSKALQAVVLLHFFFHHCPFWWGFQYSVRHTGLCCAELHKVMKIVTFNKTYQTFMTTKKDCYNWWISENSWRNNDTMFLETVRIHNQKDERLMLVLVWHCHHSSVIPDNVWTDRSWDLCRRMKTSCHLDWRS